MARRSTKSTDASTPQLKTHDLASIPQFKDYVGRLQSLGIATLEALTGTAQVARFELEAFLNTSIDQLLNQIPVAASAIPQQALRAIQNADFPLGVALEHIPLPAVAPAMVSAVVAAPQANVDLVAQMPPIRDQGERGTCVAFAALAAYEHALGRAGAMQDLSEQFLYWDCKRNDGYANQEATWLGVAYPLLQRDGCCPEGIWPYVPTPIAGNEGQGPPPAGAMLQALTFRLSGFLQLAATSVQDIKARLAADRCVSFSIPVFNSWYRSPTVAYTGDITNPIPGEVRVGGHAMCIVGYVDSSSDAAIGGGRFIIRNSWGTTWGSASPNGAGYGTIPYSYITRFATEAYSPS